MPYIAVRQQSLRNAVINFNAPTFDRHAGWLDSFDQKPRRAFIELLNRVMGCKDWQRVFDQSLDRNTRYRSITQFYVNRICRAFNFHGLRTPFVP